MFGLVKWIQEGGTLDQSTEQDPTPRSAGDSGSCCTPRPGIFVDPAHRAAALDQLLLRQGPGRHQVGADRLRGDRRAGTRSACSRTRSPGSAALHGAQRLDPVRRGGDRRDAGAEPVRPAEADAVAVGRRLSLVAGGGSRDAWRPARVGGSLLADPRPRSCCWLRWRTCGRPAWCRSSYSVMQMGYADYGWAGRPGRVRRAQRARRAPARSSVETLVADPARQGRSDLRPGRRRGRLSRSAIARCRATR